MSDELNIHLEPATVEHSPGSVISVDLLRERAREILANRKRRHDVFGKAMFGEPAWEMLLLLYVFESDQRQSVSRLARLAGASKSTGLRWLDYLESQRWIRRQVHPNDRRTAFVELSDKGRDAVELYLTDTFAKLS